MIRAALALASGALFAACSAPLVPEAPAFPETGAVRVDTLGADPTVIPFEGRAGQAVRLLAIAEDEVAIDLCIASAEAWARIQTPRGEDAEVAPPEDLAGDGLACAYGATETSGETALEEMLPRDGAYVAIVQGSGEPREVRIASAAATPLARLASGETVADTLRDDGSGFAPEAVYTVRGAAGDHLRVRVESDAFVPYVEIGAWAWAAYEPIIGAGSNGGTVTVQVQLPASGAYTVRVESQRGATGAYSVRADLVTPEAWAERFPGGGDPTERYALIASVADYPGLGLDASQDDLTGPRADADAIYALLVDDYGFAPENVVVLRDAEVTREAVAEGFRRHLAQAGEGGTAFFHYAGHGVQLPESLMPQARAEADGLDEALALWGRGGDVAFLLDHELGALAESLPAEHVVVALDNCHSGDGTRGEASGVGIRRLRYEDIADHLATPEALISDGVNVGAARHVLLSAAAAEQPSLELDGLAPDGGRAGVFTTLLVRALRGADPDESFSDVLERLRPRVEAATAEVMADEGFAPQQPQVEGAQAGQTIGAVLGPRR